MRYHPETFWLNSAHPHDQLGCVCTDQLRSCGALQCQWGGRSCPAPASPCSRSSRCWHHCKPYPLGRTEAHHFLKLRGYRYRRTGRQHHRYSNTHIPPGREQVLHQKSSLHNVIRRPSMHCWGRPTFHVTVPGLMKTGGLTVPGEAQRSLHPEKKSCEQHECKGGLAPTTAVTCSAR